MVLASWWCLHRLCRFVRSVKCSQSPRCGMIWSTTTALVRMPFAAHSRQNGSRSSCVGRKSCVQVLVLYIQCHVSDTPRALGGLCFGHQPPRVKAAHPGLRQGRSGLFAMADTSCKNKSAIANYRINGNQLWHWLFSSGFRSRNRHGAGSSARAVCLSIFKIASNLHFRQCIGKSFTTVCASIIISFVPHLGHTNQYLCF